MAIRDFSRGGDVSDRYISIDSVLDVFHGVKASIEDENKTPEEKEKEEKTTPKLEDDLKCASSCSSCKTSCPSKSKNIGLKLDDLDDDDDDDLYICEVCTKIGYSEKYDPDLCDDCHECEMCNEYINDECDGCSYSTHRDGEYYSSKLGIEDLLSEIDLDLITRVKNTDYKHERKFDITSEDFTVLDV